MSTPDPFAELFGPARGRPKPRRGASAASGRRPLSAIAGDALRQPQEPAVIRVLAAELREHCRWHVIATRDAPLFRLALASLVAGAHTAYEQRPSARSRAGRAECNLRRLALADARVLLPELVAERAGGWRAVLLSKGKQHGALTGPVLERWRRTLDEDRALLTAEQSG